MQGNRASKTSESKAEAYAWIEEAEATFRAGESVKSGISLGDMAIKEAVYKYTMAVAQGKKPNTRRLDVEIGSRIIKWFGDTSLLKIKREDLVKYRDERMKSVGASSVIQDMSFIKCLYRMARIEWGIQAEDPTIDVRRPSAPKNRMVLLTPQEITRLLDYCCVSKQQKLYCYVTLQLHTAMRPSEGASLQWSQVLFDYGVIDLTETKTDPRRVPMTQTGRTMLSEMKREGEYVFLPEGKESLSSRYFRRSFNTACRDAGITGFTMYGLRHSAASYLIMNGVGIRDVAEIMGHKRLEQTMRYTHYLDEHKIKAISVLDNIGG